MKSTRNSVVALDWKHNNGGIAGDLRVFYEVFELAVLRSSCSSLTLSLKLFWWMVILIHRLGNPTTILWNIISDLEPPWLERRNVTHGMMHYISSRVFLAYRRKTYISASGVRIVYFRDAKHHQAKGLA
jgi:hypothetical protein